MKQSRQNWASHHEVVHFVGADIVLLCEAAASISDVLADELAFGTVLSRDFKARVEYCSELARLMSSKKRTT